MVWVNMLLSHGCPVKLYLEAALFSNAALLQYSMLLYEKRMDSWLSKLGKQTQAIPPFDS